MSIYDNVRNKEKPLRGQSLGSFGFSRIFFVDLRAQINGQN